jgi:hypothetical protein
MRVNEDYKIYVGCFCVRSESVIGHQVLETASPYIYKELTYHSMRSLPCTGS